jgi:hypothetical protein
MQMPPRMRMWQFGRLLTEPCRGRRSVAHPARLTRPTCYSTIQRSYSVRSHGQAVRPFRHLPSDDRAGAVCIKAGVIPKPDREVRSTPYIYSTYRPFISFGPDIGSHDALWDQIRSICPGRPYTNGDCHAHGEPLVSIGRPQGALVCW